MAFIFGTPVTGANFINREIELMKLQDEIDLRANENCETPHIEISAPRRIGKTSLLMEMGERLKKRGFTSVYVYLVETSTPDEFFAKLRDTVLDSLSLFSSNKEKFLNWISSVRLNPGNIKPTYDFEGNLTISAEDVLGLYKGTWKENGIALFEMLRKYMKKRIVLFLDEMGFVRKMNADDQEKQAFLNYLDSELSNPATPVCVICGSQNFFDILRNIKPEIYQLWRRKFLRIEIKCFDKNATVNKLLMPIFLSMDVLKVQFITQDIVRKLSEYIYFVSNGYPSMAQLLGKDIAFGLRLVIESGEELNNKQLKNIVFQVINDDILKDTQRLCKEIISQEALGANYAIYKELIYELYNNENLNIERLRISLNGYALDERLREIEEMQYIELDGISYKLSYNFLKYYIWHPRKDDKTRKELEDKWQEIF